MGFPLCWRGGSVIIRASQPLQIIAEIALTKEITMTSSRLDTHFVDRNESSVIFVIGGGRI